MLTEKQRTLLVFIHDCLNERGVSPSFDEMKDALSLKSKSGIHRLITALEERGFLKRLPHRARALEVTRLPDDMQTQQPIANRRFAALSRENDGLSADGLRPAPPWLESVTAGRPPGPDDFEGDKGLDEQALANDAPNVERAAFGRADRSAGGWLARCRLERRRRLLIWLLICLQSRDGREDFDSSVVPDMVP